MVRLALVLAIAGGLVLFALQNLAPISLVILGVSSQPLPLAIWVLGAIVAGSLSTLVISGLFSASTAFAAPRARRATPRSPNRSSSASNASRSTWSNPTPNPATPPKGSTQSVMGDDWEPRPPLEEWEDWDGYEEPAQASTREPASYSSDRYTQRSRYSQPEDVATTTTPREEVWDDWDDEGDDDGDESSRQGSYSSRRDSLDDESYIPRRTDFEVPQEPISRRQSGSIYSYSYRNGDSADDSVVGRTEDVYDAEFRVITPPYHPEPEPELDPGDDELDSRNSEDWIGDVHAEDPPTEQSPAEEPRRGDRRSDLPKGESGEDW